MAIFRKAGFIHIVAVLFMLGLPILFTPWHAFESTHAFLLSKFFLLNILLYVSLLLFFYLHYYYILPAYYFNQKYYVYFTLILVCFGIFVFLFFLNDFRPPRRHSHHEGHQHPRHHRMMPVIYLTQSILIYLIGIFTTLFLRTRQNLIQLYEAHTKKQIEHLTAQINPHFLFNTYNSIYSLAIKENAKQTASGLLKLSDMMRYVVTQSSSEFVLVSHEVEYLRNFIELQKLRLANNVGLEVNLPKVYDNSKIAPMLLIPFIENAFKHGVNPDQQSNISIFLEVKEKDLILKVSNKKVKFNETSTESLGFGLENTRMRLQLLYPQNHSLDIQDVDNIFSVHLHINLKP